MTRTRDLLITNQLLYQLSYAGLGTRPVPDGGHPTRTGARVPARNRSTPCGALDTTSRIVEVSSNGAQRIRPEAQPTRSPTRAA